MVFQRNASLSTSQQTEFVRLSARDECRLCCRWLFFFVLATGAWLGESIADTAETIPQHSTAADLLDHPQPNAGYRIVVQGAMSERQIASLGRQEDINDAIVQLMRDLGVTSHASVIDAENKVVQIIILGEMPDHSLTTGLTMHDQTLTSLDFSPEELEEIKSDYMRLKNNASDGVYISPGSEFGVGIRRSELEDIKAQHFWKQELGNGHATVPTPSAEGHGLSAHESVCIENAHLEAAREPRRSLTPGSDTGPGISTYELAEIKNAYLASAMDPTRRVSPGFGVGPGITTEELEALKTEYSLNMHRSFVDERMESE